MTGEQTLYCSFCGESQQKCEWLIVGAVCACICATCIDDCAAQLARLRRDKIEQDALIKEALHCAFCQPAPIACEGEFNGR